MLLCVRKEYQAAACDSYTFRDGDPSLGIQLYNPIAREKQTIPLTLPGLFALRIPTQERSGCNALLMKWCESKDIHHSAKFCVLSNRMVLQFGIS
jgi:hypothetical protein